MKFRGRGLNNASKIWIREPRPVTLIAHMKQAWSARSLIVFFAREALLKSTRRTVLGWLWLPLRGVIPTLIGAFVFGGVFGVNSALAPYPLFLLAGLIPWVLFAATASWSVRCLEISRRYLRASAFPRMVLPLGFTAPALVDALMFLLAYLLFFAWFALSGHRAPFVGGGVIVASMLAFSAGLGWGLLLCIPGARARDVRFTLGFVLSAIFALTPIAYPAQLVPEAWRWLVELNPLVGIVEGFRAGLLGGAALSMQTWLLSIVFSLASLLAGLWVFVHYEETFSGNK